MTADRRSRRAGFSIIELIAVLVTVVVLGGMILPTLGGIRGDTRTKAAGDMVQEYMARSRAKAIEGGQAYRLAVSSDGRRVRMAPDTFEAMGEAAPEASDEDGAGPTIREDDLPAGVTASLLLDDGEFAADDAIGWRRVATFLPDGTCREDTVEVRVEEADVAPVLIRLRGLTGACTQTRVRSAAP